VDIASLEGVAVRRSLLLFPLALAFALLAPAGAGAGGFATAGLSSTPDGVAPGKPWKVDITLLQHGRTPLEGMTPRVVISSGDATREFAAKPTGKPGVYRAEVVFPRAGQWDYVVLDSFNDAMPHTFPSVRIGDGGAAIPAAAPPIQAPAPDDGGIAEGWLWGAGAALVLAFALLAGDRLRRRPATAPRGAEPA
jgi:hypothetical protein